MEPINVNSLNEGMSFTSDVHIDNSFLLLPQTVPVTAELIKALDEWKFKEIYCDGNVSLGGDIGLSKNVTHQEEPVVKREQLNNSVKEALDEFQNIGTTSKKHAEAVKKVYIEYANYIEKIFTRYATHKEINQEDLTDSVKDLCVFVKDNKRYILRLLASSELSDRNFLISHSTKTTILAICIALQLRTPLSKMIELGVTCILHEIGMLQIPPQLYMTDKKFSPAERAQITKHTVFGYTIIKNLDFPLSVQLGVLEHHEKENGTGYPRHLTGDKISNYAKIIAVACSYEAISSPRKYKDERSTFDAIVEMLHNKNKQYDDAVVKALLYTVSLYPIGTYVYLSNRKVGVVSDANPINPKWPVVQLITEREANGAPKTIQTDENGITILRILSKQEKEDILKIVEEKYKNEAIHEEVSENEEETFETPSEENAPVQDADTNEAVPANKPGSMEDVDINMFS